MFTAKPLLLFYGLSQAGRALAAAASTVANDSCRLSGHGITVKDLAASNNCGLAKIVVGPQEGAFRQVSAILQASDFADEASIGELWPLLPETARFPLPDSRGLRALEVQRRWSTTNGGVVTADLIAIPSDVGKGGVHVGGSDGSLTVPESATGSIREFLSSYPTLGGLTFPGRSVLLRPVGTQGFSLAVEWPLPEGVTDIDEALDAHALNYLSARRAFPAVGSGPLAAHPFLAWWAILYTLSMLARYQPDAWSKYVNVAKSADAVPIEALLSNAINTLPETIHRTLMSVSR